MIIALGEQSIGPLRRTISVRYPECICQPDLRQWPQKSQFQKWERAWSSLLPNADLPHIWGFICQAPLQPIARRYRYLEIIATHGSVSATVVNESIIDEVVVGQSENCSCSKLLSRLAGSFRGADCWQVVALKAGRAVSYDASAFMERDSNIGRRVL